MKEEKVIEMLKEICNKIEHYGDREIINAVTKAYGITIYK